MNAVFVVGGLDVYVQASGERRFFLSGISRTGSERTPLGIARWEPGDAAFDLHIHGQEAYFPEGSQLLEDLVTRLDAVRTWYRAQERPDPHLGILIGDNTASH
jgi:hypothetical protein